MFIDNGIGNFEAREILLFLPIAFVRKLLPNIKWPETYIEYKDEKNTFERKFEDSNAFNIVSEITERYFENSPDSDVIIKVAGRSSEFQVINKLLIDNPNTKVEDIELTKTVVVR